MSTYHSVHFASNAQKIEVRQFEHKQVLIEIERRTIGDHVLGANCQTQLWLPRDVARSTAEEMISLCDQLDAEDAQSNREELAFEEKHLEEILEVCDG